MAFVKNVKNTFQLYKGFITRENYQDEVITNAMMRLKGNHYTEMNEESLSCVCKSRQICKIMNGYYEEYTFHL